MAGCIMLSSNFKAWEKQREFNWNWKSFIQNRWIDQVKLRERIGWMNKESDFRNILSRHDRLEEQKVDVEMEENNKVIQKYEYEFQWRYNS